MAQYRLNESFLFDDETFQITQLSSSRAPIKLSATATRCLKVLIEHQGETVNKDKLIHESWGKFGMMVTEGSMWKNISQLRQGFQKLQVPYEVIITVPRLGYTFSSQMIVERVESPVRNYPDPAVVLPPDKVPIITVEESDTISTEILPLSPERPDSRSNGRILYYLIVTVIVVNLIAAAGYTFWLNQNKVLLSFDSATEYKKIASLADTQVFVRRSLTQNSLYVKDALTRFMQEQPQTAKGKQPGFVYINTVKSRSVSSYFLCDRAITEQNNGCTSYFSLKGEVVK